MLLNSIRRFNEAKNNVSLWPNPKSSKDAEVCPCQQARTQAEVQPARAPSLRRLKKEKKKERKIGKER